MCKMISWVNRWCVILSLLAGCTVLAMAQAPQKSDPARAIQSLIQGPDYKNAHWGILVMDAESGQTLFEQNADRLFVPASTTKLYSCAAALAVFGPDHRFVTPIVRSGEVKDGVLMGDLVLIAKGDFTLGGRTGEDGQIQFRNIDHTYANGSLDSDITSCDPLAGLKALARQVAAHGIKQIQGRIIIDDRLFDGSETTGSGPRRLTPIMLNDNLIDLQIQPAAEAGQLAAVEWRPKTAAFQVDIQVETVDAEKPLHIKSSSPQPGRLVVRGQIPKGHKPLLRVHEVDDPASFARACLIEELQQAGVRVDASLHERNAASALPSQEQVNAWPIVAELPSPPLGEMLKLVLKVSHNLHASALPMMLATKNGERTLEKGLRQQGNILRKLGVDVDSIALGSGAGGSRSDLTSPRVTVQLLMAMRQRPDFPAFQAALPILGIDGTLYNVLEPGSPAKGQIQAKTGTYYLENHLNGRIILTSKALAGYATTHSGRKVVFTLFVNYTHLQSPKESIREGKMLAKLCEAIYLHF